MSKVTGARNERQATVVESRGQMRKFLRRREWVAFAYDHMPPERIRTLPFGTGLVLLRSTPPIVPQLQPWTDRHSTRTSSNASTVDQDPRRNT